MTGHVEALNGVIALLVYLACVTFAVLMIAAICVILRGEPFDITHDDDQPDDEPMAASSSADPASRALAARESWADPQGDQFTAVVLPVAEVVPFEPECTCGDAAVIAEMEAGFTVTEQSSARSLNRGLSKLPYRGRS